jgi:hypothetical protein
VDVFTSTPTRAEQPGNEGRHVAFTHATWHGDCYLDLMVATSRSRLVSCVVLTASLVLATAACKTDEKTEVDGSDEPDKLAEDGTDAAAAEIDAEIVTSSLVSATASGGSLTLASTELTSDELATAGVGDGAKAIYFPRNCLTVASDEAAKTVTYTFADCTGPNAIFKINGVITATYEVAPGKLVLRLVGNDLRINRAVIDWSSTAEIAADGPGRSMHWKGTLSGTTARGKTFSRTNEKLVTWRFGERCFGVSGVSEGTVRDRYLRTEIADFRRCQGACPEAGGRITISNEAKVKVEILYDGSNRATYSTPKGSITFALACQG